jgi:prepilin-type N-terminal cleavage/methylation domain-containing protein
MSNTRGFTLVEMAIVLVIVGILVGLGVGMITPLTTMTKDRETRESLAANRESIVSWAASNNRVPTTALFPNIATISGDPWGQQLVYLYDNSLAPAIPTKDTICGRRSTALRVVTTAPAATIDNVAFVLLSSGSNGLVGTTLTASAVPVIAATLNGAASGPAIANGARGNATGVVTLDITGNDIVSWVTLDELRTKIGCQGAQLKIINNGLPSGTVASPYPSATAGASVTISVDGGATPGNLRWCIEAPAAAALPAGLVFNFAVPVRVAPNTCNGPLNPLAEAGWIAPAPSAPLTITGNPAAGSQGSYNFTVFVRDNDATAVNDNIASKAFVMTINPQ